MPQSSHTCEQTPASSPPATKEERWALVLRIAASSSFRRSPRLRELLLYIGRRGIDNAFEDLKEQRIGCEVFRRPQDYTPAEDNIVRVEAGILRKRLAHYFSGEGRDEPIVLSIPKGSYLPVFEPAALELPPSAPVPPCVEAVPPSPAPVSPLHRSATFWRSVSAALAVLCICLATWGYVAVHTRNRPGQNSPPLWNYLFDGKSRTYLVCADSALALLQDLTNSPISLADYVNRRYGADNPAAPPETRLLARVLPDKQYTSVADVYLISRFLQMGRDVADRVFIRTPRTLIMEDFKSNNFVLLGSSRANPWADLFANELNFAWEFPNGEPPRIRNRHPHAGEQLVYVPQGRGYSASKTYAIVALVPNLNRSGNVLMIGGTSLIGTQAAGEYVTGADFQEFLTKIGTRPDHVRYFELLLESNALAGTPETSKLIATRLIE